MGWHQTRLLLCSAASITLIASALFVLAWFHIDLAGTHVTIGVRSGTICVVDGTCTTISLRGTGAYQALAEGAFWAAVLLAVLVIAQCGLRVFNGSASQLASRIGYALGSITLLCAFGAGYVFAPEPPADLDVPGLVVARTFAPVWLVLGSLLGMLALRHAQHEPISDDVAEYKPVVVLGDVSDERRGQASSRARASSESGARTRAASDPGVRQRNSSQEVVKIPLPGHRTTSQHPVVARTMSPSQPIERIALPGDRTRSPSQPIVARTTSPSQPPLVARTSSPARDLVLGASDPALASGARGQSDANPAATSGIAIPARAHSSSSGPIDLAARLSGAPIAVAIKPPLPEPIPVPPDQIPVAPESGLVIRKRTPSAGPLSAHPLQGSSSPVSESTPTIDADSVPAIARAFTPPDKPAALRGRLRYAVDLATLSSHGITALREDGTTKHVGWDDIIGIIARRLPAETPYAGATFVDLVSTSGSTLRVLPWTRLDGAPMRGDGEERARAFVQLIAARCLEAKLDSWTKVFADGAGHAAQLPSANTLAAHDDKLA